MGANPDQARNHSLNGGKIKMPDKPDKKHKIVRFKNFFKPEFSPKKSFQVPQGPFFQAQTSHKILKMAI